MSIELTFLACVFLAVILLSQALFIPVYRPKRGDTRVVKERLNRLAQERGEEGAAVSIAMENRLKKASVLGRVLESNRFVSDLSFKLQQSGSKMLGYQFLLLALITSLATGLAVWIWRNEWFLALLSGVIVLVLFNVKLNRDFNSRMEKIEEQFPEALDILRRGIQAGYAFPDAVKLTYEEMDGPIAYEFKLLFADINYGKDTRRALLHFIERVPSVSAMAFSTAVQVQKETGGNLAENIQNLSRIIRQRFRFQRQVKTYSAQGRMSAWVLVSVPLALFGYLYLSSPTYARELTDTEVGNTLLIIAGIGMLIGIVWISRLIKIEV
ncbi:type II secretion system F family protein [Ferrimonas balearica]|uniref:type II secretion system F family protein n=1 Tax=Ferrimonas balearica TaxID=44012 RepID=UPI001C99A080|nr:type II secretion system F family protein [Ferrimonas balearica]MBY5920832.1 type II secretion system F family protein [Ferrimonas balearica]MBY5996483.1 type II secretion system F family protein [Ferrimonas balearica]